MSHIIAVTSNRGGSGTTTAAAQLADAMGIRQTVDLSLYKGLHVINNVRPDEQKWLMLDGSSPELLAEAISASRKAGKSLLIDCGLVYHPLARLAISVADMVIAAASFDDRIFDADIHSLNAVINEINESEGVAVTAHVLLSRIHTSRKSLDSAMTTIEGHGNLSALSSRICLRADYANGLSKHGSGVTAIKGSDASEASREVRALADEVTSLLAPVTA